MTPFWVGVLNTIFSKALSMTPFKATILGSPRIILAVMSFISSATWIYTIVFCDLPLSTVFLPPTAAQEGFTDHMRRALQMDELCIFTSGFAWLTFLFYDLHLAGLMGKDWVIKAALLPVLAAVAGPGAAFAFGWYWRESLLKSKLAKE
jgi:hypothetical protein